jgi:type I restriction enzyme S subunit
VPSFGIDTVYFVDKRHTSAHLRWLYWALHVLGLEVTSQDTGVPGLARETAYSIKLALPPLPEQAAIAAFLDRETAKIDALVEEQRRLIELLKEKRQALISHTVTKGLDSETPMKDSGVEWLGEVPAHWLIGPVGARYDVQLGQMLNEERTRGDFLKPYLRVFDVQWDSINTEDLPQMNFPPSAQVRYQLKPGDLLVNEGGSYVGRSAIWRGEIEECYYQKALHRLRARDPSTETAEFFLFVMEMATQVGVFVAEGNQTTIDHLTAEQLRATRVAFPPPLEQKAIAEYLQRETANLLALIEEIASAIALLQERRSALISATVTGKIDVRGQVAEAKAPEEAAAA